MAEVLLVVFVYAMALYVWPRYVALNVPTWYAMPTEGGRQLFPAGWWFVYVSNPVAQFILLRWYFRLFVWMRFLWQVARCELSLVPTHPDRVGGLGFLSGTVVAFAPLLVAHGHAAGRADREPDPLPGGEVAGVQGRDRRGGRISPASRAGAAAAVHAAPGPGPAHRPARVRDPGSALRAEFDEKWIRGSPPSGEPLVGSADIQSLADLGNTYEIVRSMRTVPFTRDTVLRSR